MCKHEQKCRYNYTIDVYIKTQLFTHQNLKTLASGFFFSTDYIATQNKLPLNLYKAKKICWQIIKITRWLANSIFAKACPFPTNTLELLKSFYRRHKQKKKVLILYRLFAAFT